MLGLDRVGKHPEGPILTWDCDYNFLRCVFVHFSLLHSWVCNNDVTNYGDVSTIWVQGTLYISSLIRQRAYRIIRWVEIMSIECCPFILFSRIRSLLCLETMPIGFNMQQYALPVCYYLESMPTG